MQACGSPHGKAQLSATEEDHAVTVDLEEEDVDDVFPTTDQLTQPVSVHEVVMEEEVDVDLGSADQVPQPVVVDEDDVEVDVGIEVELRLQSPRFCW